MSIRPLFVAVILLLAFPAEAATRNGELDSAWRSYLKTQTHIEPAYRFPHSTCVGAAAIEHDLPETLLLAVARGESDFDATA